MKSIYTLVGMKYRDAVEFVASLPAGEPLTLSRDRHNDFDQNAIEVWARDRHVGFVKATEARSLARYMDDKGESIGFGLVGRLVFDGDRWPKIEVEQ